MKIKMTGIPVQDPNAALKIYTEKLNFKVHTHMPEMQLAIVVSPEDENGTTLLLEPCGDGFAKTYKDTIYNMGMPIIIMGVDSVQKEYERLKELGFTFKSEPKTDDWGTSAIFDDQCGNYIQIHQDK